MAFFLMFHHPGPNHLPSSREQTGKNSWEGNVSHLLRVVVQTLPPRRALRTKNFRKKERDIDFINLGHLSEDCPHIGTGLP